MKMHIFKSGGKWWIRYRYNLYHAGSFASACLYGRLSYAADVERLASWPMYPNRGNP